MKVCVIGLGYIGLPTAAVIANAGHDVLGVDINVGLIERIRQGQITIVNEDGLEEMVRAAIATGRLKVATEPSWADIFVVAVPTPFQEDRTARVAQFPVADLGFVISAAKAISRYLRPGNLLILESTVPPGTTRGVLVETLVREGVDTEQILIAHAPERVMPGNVMYELIHNTRIVGGLTREATEAACAFFRSFVKGDVLGTDATTAEFVKLMENTFRDINIALANEFALVSEYLGINIWEAISLANLHPRVNILSPGPGVGGHCIAVDPYFVVQVAPHLTSLIQTARKVNTGMPEHVVALLEELVAGHGSKIALLGASYKADVGDSRESPALKVAYLLEARGYVVKVHDPFIQEYNVPMEHVVADADALLLLTDHKIYKSLDPYYLKSLMSTPRILDTRGILDVEQWRRAGFIVSQLGVGTSRVQVTT